MLLAGYGDYSPVSRCSQTIAVLTGFFGMFCMGISVSILSRYLQLTFDEYCMLSYYMDADLEKQKQHAAAQIIKMAWLEYRSRSNKDAYERLKMQRKLLKALHYKKDIEYKKISSRERRERQVSDEATGIYIHRLIIYTATQLCGYKVSAYISHTPICRRG